MATWGSYGFELYINAAANHPSISLHGIVDASLVPGGKGRFEVTRISAGLDSRECKATGTLTAPEVPARLTAKGEPFDLDLDLTLADCSIAPIVLRGRVRVVLMKEPPREL
jgi:hypothetical protein